VDNNLIPVTALDEGEEGIVYSLAGGEGFSSRIAGMGIIPGIKIKVLRNIGGLIIVFASDTRIALGRGEAHKILVAKTQTSVEEIQKIKTRKTFLVALAGQPNVGKSTVFNVITGLSQHVGNWPGKTVEKKEGFHTSGDYDIKIVDLPGTYSLSAFSEEERVARDFIIHEHPDVIIMIVSAAALERNLYLLSELLILGPPVAVGLNMIDVAEAQGIHIDVEVLQKSLNIPVVPMVATKNRGIKELITTAINLARDETAYNPKMPGVSSDHQDIFNKLIDFVREHVPPPHQETWAVIKLMEGDPEVTEELRQLMPVSVWNEVRTLLIKHEDALRSVVGGRYDWIEDVTRATISRFKMGQVLITDRIDHVLTRPIIGVPILLGILGFVFTLTFAIGFPLQKLFESGMSSAGQLIEAWLTGAPFWIKGILIEGILGGAGSVLTFVPLLIIFFAAMAFLEDIGYMARAAFVMDRFMHIIGLHGKSFMPMCLGFGCNVPSILGTRIVESKKARLLTIFLTPFVPCTARLAVLTFITAAVFGEKAMIVSWALVAINLIALGVAGMLVSKFMLKDEPLPFIMELPLYHKPDIKTIVHVIWSRTFSFIKKAGTVILVFSVVIWLFSNIPGEKIEDSVLGIIGKFIEPIGSPLGLDWKMLVALMSSAIAKENSIATLGVLYNVGEQGLRNVLPVLISHPSALSFLVSLMLFIPCVPAIVVMKQEMGSWKWFSASFVAMLLISYIGGMIAYRTAIFFGL
jgi:ferrous iron transport protein B